MVRAERLEEPDLIIPAILERVKKEYLQKTYDLEDWTDYEDFLAKVYCVLNRNDELVRYQEWKGLEGR